MRPLGLNLYRAATGLLSPLAPLWLKHRAKHGKEDAERLGERTGKPGAGRPDAFPDGPLVWLHGASVGEAEMALNLMQEIGAARTDVRFLLTSGTRTSATLIAKRLGKNARHQYLPLDTPGAVRRFLSHWHPETGVFIESELWPNLILAAQERGIKLALVNARMNARSLHRWKHAPASAAHLLGAFDWIGAADEQTTQGLQGLTSQTITNTGNLKQAAPAPPVNKSTLVHLKKAFGARPVWLAASTHEGEEEIVLAAHRKICTDHPGAALILVPRHPERAERIAALCKQSELPCNRHSTSKTPDKKASVYIGDSIGEMGLWLRLASPAFIGGSLLPALTGHNPLEAIKLGAPVLTGPYHTSFATLYTDLLREKGALEVNTSKDIAQAVLNIWDDTNYAKAMTDAAQSLTEQNVKAPLATTLAAVLPLIGETS